MAKIETIDDFKKLTSSITSFSHAYLFNVNSLEQSLMYAKEFAKLLFYGHNYENEKYQNMIYQIDHDEFDDLYIVNPDTISINTDEINKLLKYMETKSLRDNGKRVYIIYGFERLSRDVSNKILKFLEEPKENIYAILLTANMDKILSTIISRCQVLTISFPLDDINLEYLNNMKNFLEFLYHHKYQTIAYINNFFGNIITDRKCFLDQFNIIEIILSENLNRICGRVVREDYVIDLLDKIPTRIIVNILNITNNLKRLIKNNINLNLLLDRYIIEVTRELISCQK